MKRRLNGFFFFVSSCVPGCGQMYQGYMKRGLSLMLIFWGLLAVAFFLNIEALIVFLIPTWLYTFFDSYNLRARQESGAVEDDGFLFGLPEMDSARFDALCRRRHSVIGWVLVALGLWMLYERVARRLLDALQYYFDVAGWLYSFFTYDIPRLVVTMGIIALGIWFIRGPKKTAPAEDIPTFTPPVQQPQAEQPAEQRQEDGHGEE